MVKFGEKTYSDLLHSFETPDIQNVTPNFARAPILVWAIRNIK